MSGQTGAERDTDDEGAAKSISKAGQIADTQNEIRFLIAESAVRNTEDRFQVLFSLF